MSAEVNTTIPPVIPGQLQEQLEIEENANDDAPEEEIVRPTGVKLWMAITSIILSSAFVGLDMTIVAVAVPSLSNQFKQLNHIGWYSATYQLIYSSFVFFTSRFYTLFPIKYTFIVSMCLFQLGSLICTVAPTSVTFILGRAIAGFGSSGIQIGGIVCLTYCLPVHKRPFWTGVVGAVSSVGLVIAPLIGGVLIDSLSWRACFGINLPIGALTIGLTAYGLRIQEQNPNSNLTLWKKLNRLDIPSTAMFVPAIVCLLIGLQWGGITYGWGDVRIIMLFVVFGVLLSAFGWMQYRKKDDAILSPRIMKRSVIAGAWFGACCNGILAVVEYYISVYFQGVKGYSATNSGALGLSLFGGMTLAGLAAGIGTSFFGYYYPFMLASSVLTPIASGLLTTIEFNESIIKVLFLLVFLGAAVGFGIQTPTMVIQTILPQKDIAAGAAFNGFAGTLASSLFISVSATLFQSRLFAELEKYAPGTNTTIFDGGLADVRGEIGPAKLGAVLAGYDEAVVQTLYIPVALATSSVLASVVMERTSVKKIQ